MSGRKLYLVKWDRGQESGNGATASRIFRQEHAAIRWMLTMCSEDKDATVYVAPMPEWEEKTIPHAVCRRHTTFVRRRVQLRAAAREKWGKS